MERRLTASGAATIRIAERIAVLWGVPILPQRIQFEWSGRLTRSLARCRPREGRITLASWLQDAKFRLLEEVVCHELAHVVVFDRHGRGVRPHGPEWSALVRLAGFEPRVRVSVEDKAARIGRSHVLYEHSCPVCQSRWRARRPVRNWRCRACRETGLAGHLEIRRLDAESAP